MELFEIENKRISNRFYNLAIDRVNTRDLFGASIYLKKSLIYNSKNFSARNLLGLILYEEGAITDAIVQFLISRDLVKSEVNPAKMYLYKLQRDPDTENHFESIKIMNDAIDDIKIGRYDLAMMKLYKAIEKNEHNVKAMTILSILLLRIKDHIKAGAYLLKCKKIDNGNKFINDYMDYVMKNTKKGETKERTLRNVFSLKKLESDDAIISRRYIKLTENQKVIFVLIGIIIGALSFSILFSPKGSKSNEKEITKFANLVNDQNKIIRDITIENEQLKKDYGEASVRLRAYEDQNKMFTSQYETLNGIIRDFDGGYISRAAKNYVELDKDSITDETLITLLNQAKSRIEGIGAKRLCELGTESWNAGNKTAAISYYQLSLSINPDDPETMFLLARLYQNLDRLKEANAIFDKIIAQHPESGYAKRSREARGY